MKKLLALMCGVVLIGSSLSGCSRMMTKIQIFPKSIEFTDDLIKRKDNFVTTVKIDPKRNCVYFRDLMDNWKTNKIVMYDISKGTIKTLKTVDSHSEIVGKSGNNLIINQFMDDLTVNILSLNIDNQTETTLLKKALAINCNDKCIIYKDSDYYKAKKQKYWFYRINDGLKKNFCTNKERIEKFILMDDKIIWANKRVDSGILEDVIIYDAKTNKYTKCNKQYVHGDISASGDFIVWGDDLYCNRTKMDKGNTKDLGDIYGYQISTGKIFPIDISDDYSSYQPTISGSYVFWTDNFKDGNVVSFSDISKTSNVVCPASTLASHKAAFGPGLCIDSDIAVWEDDRFQKQSHNLIMGYSISNDTEFQLSQKQGRNMLLAVSYPYVVYDNNNVDQSGKCSSELRIITIKQ